MDVNASISYPVPLVFAGQISYRFLIYLNLTQDKSEVSVIYPPSKSVDINLDTFDIVATRDYQSSNQIETQPIGQFAITQAQLAEVGLDLPGLTAKFDALYQKAIQSFVAFKTKGGEFDFPQEEKDQLAQYFKILIPQSLMAYYIDLESHFFSLLGIYYK